MLWARTAIPYEVGAQPFSILASIFNDYERTKIGTIDSAELNSCNIFDVIA